jgi:hypothetical protein
MQTEKQKQYLLDPTDSEFAPFPFFLLVPTLELTCFPFFLIVVSKLWQSLASSLVVL